ncbi:MAG: hypothetical protein Q7S27_04015 [Nanoarchaeota archaeon]|nr:hypothetical protein [Nanoarchaeota archaeon]
MSHPIRNLRILTTKVKTARDTLERRTLTYKKDDEDKVPRLILNSPFENRPLAHYKPITNTYRPEAIQEMFLPLERELNGQKHSDVQFRQKLDNELSNYGWVKY